MAGDLSDWLERLAAGTPAPGGGAVAALAAATAAALLAMTCRVTAARTAGETSDLAAVVAEADRLRISALGLMDADGAAYGAVIAARKLPRASDEEQSARTSAIDEALLGAAEVPLSTARNAAAIIDLTERVRASANRNVLADLEAGVIAARAAIAISLLNARTNLATMTDARRSEKLSGELAALESWSG